MNVKLNGKHETVNEEASLFDFCEDKLSRKEIKEAEDFDREQALALVSSYYAVQKARIATGNRLSANKRGVDTLSDPVMINWLKEKLTFLEKQTLRSLKAYSESKELGRWALSQLGVGHVIAAGFLAHIDLNIAQTAGAIWRFAGIDPTIVWKKGQKRPYNAQLKVLCWKLGESFKKVHNNPNAFYGKLWKERKEREIARNEAGLFHDYALNILEEAVKKGRRISDEQRAAWSAGRVPPLGLDRMAGRYVVKIFLSHYHTVGREIMGLPLVRPWVLEHGGHAHYIAPPNWPMK